MKREQVAAWLAAHPLEPGEVDCATAVMLKILDGKCKMAPGEKERMTALYDALEVQRGQTPGLRFGAELHALIARARQTADDSLKELLYERRVLAESAISRPVMKAFKARLRAQGLLPEQKADAEQEP